MFYEQNSGQLNLMWNHRVKFLAKKIFQTARLCHFPNVAQYLMITNLDIEFTKKSWFYWNDLKLKLSQLLTSFHKNLARTCHNGISSCHKFFSVELQSTIYYLCSVSVTYVLSVTFSFTQRNKEFKYLRRKVGVRIEYTFSLKIEVWIFYKERAAVFTVLFGSVTNCDKNWQITDPTLKLISNSDPNPRFV